MRGEPLEPGVGLRRAANHPWYLACAHTRARRRDLRALAAQHAHPAEEREYDPGDDRVEGEAREEDGHLALGDVRLGQGIVDDRPVDADRREAARLGAVHDHHAHQQRVDAELHRESEGDRGDDRNRRRADRTDGRQQGGDGEHDPRNGADPPSHGSHRELHEPVHGSVALGEREQVGDAHEHYEDVAREHPEDVVGRHVGGESADQECRRERK